MAKSPMPQNPRQDEVLPQIKSVVDLPSPDTKRWVPRHKAAIVNVVRQGCLSLEEACRRYELSVEEFLIWSRAIETHGVAGLRVTPLRRLPLLRRVTTSISTFL